MKKKFLLIFHLVSVLLAMAALSLLVVFAALEGVAAYVVGVALYGSALVLFYLLRTLQFVFRERARRELFLRLDHVAVYFLLAMSVMPVALVLPNRGWAWVLFGVTVGVSVAAMLLRAFTRVPSSWVATGVYAVLLVVDALAFREVHDFLSEAAVFWLSLGALAYISATLLVMLRPSWRWVSWLGSHEDAALFLAMAGSFCHFWAMLRFVV